MEESIIEKLNTHILSGINKESDVVYLMVETRKILERTDNKYPLLKFYCDWILHNKKDNITSDIKKIMEKINKSIPKDIKKSPYPRNYRSEILEFIFMKGLREEFKSFFRCFKLSEGSRILFMKGKNWIRFVNLLTKVLADQPIMNPIKEIEYFAFEPNEGGLISCVIRFNDARKRCRFVDFIVLKSV